MNNLAIDEERFQKRNIKIFSIFSKIRLNSDYIPTIDRNFQQILAKKKFLKQSKSF